MLVLVSTGETLVRRRRRGAHATTDGIAHAAADEIADEIADETPNEKPNVVR